MIQSLQELILKLNEMFVAPPMLVNLITGLVFVVTLLSMKHFHRIPAAPYKWSKVLYYSGCISMLLALSINRFIGYPATYPVSSFIYLLGYLFFCGYVLYTSWSHTEFERGLDAKQTDKPE